MSEDGWLYKLKFAIDNANTINDLTLIHNVLFGELQLVERKSKKIQMDEKEKLNNKFDEIIKEHQTIRRNC